MSCSALSLHTHTHTHRERQSEQCQHVPRRNPTYVTMSVTNAKKTVISNPACTESSPTLLFTSTALFYYNYFDQSITIILVKTYTEYMTLKYFEITFVFQKTFRCLSWEKHPNNLICVSYRVSEISAMPYIHFAQICQDSKVWNQKLKISTWPQKFLK